MASSSPRCVLSFLHDEYHKGRVSFSTSRSINRLRAALNDIASDAGGIGAARHAARFNLIGKSRRLHDDIVFAANTITSFDKSRSAATKKSELAAKRIALKVHLGCIKGSARRKAGSWSIQSSTTASLGPLECKVFCRHIITLIVNVPRVSAYPSLWCVPLSRALKKLCHASGNRLLLAGWPSNRS